MPAKAGHPYVVSKALKMNGAESWMIRFRG